MNLILNFVLIALVMVAFIFLIYKKRVGWLILSIVYLTDLVIGFVLQYNFDSWQYSLMFILGIWGFIDWRKNKIVDYGIFKSIFDYSKPSQIIKPLTKKEDLFKDK